MRIADKIQQFDNMMPANLKQFEELFELKVESSYKDDDLVEILEPVLGGFRRVLINDKPELIDLNPRIDGRSKADVYAGGRKFYKYTATNLEGTLIAEAYSVSEIAQKVGVSKETILNIIKRKNEIPENTGGRKRLNLLIKREELENKKDRKLVIKNKKRFYFIIMKDGKEIAKFKGAKKAGEFIKVSEASIINYASGKYKNKDGYKVIKKEIED